MILNISPDHLERHQNLRKYVDTKFKLIESQSSNSLAFVKKNDELIYKKLRSKKFNSKIIKVDTTKNYKFLKKIKNNYFFTKPNKENLSFVIEISKKLKIKKHLLLKVIEKFKGLKFRQQVIFKKNNLTVINDSKSTSFYSTIDILKQSSNVFWILGGIHKKGDKFDLKKKDMNNVRAFIFGKNKDFFIRKLKKKVKIKYFSNLKNVLKNIFYLIEKEKLTHNTILFSPCAASFDSFKNFEDRGLYFNKLVKRYLNEI